MSRRRLLTSSVLASLAGAGLVFALVLAAIQTVETHPRITTTLLWQKDIAPIMQRRCFSCHSPNNLAFSLASYSDARPWAVAIREEVLARHMPPWGAAPGFGRFVNDPSLTQGEWDLLVAWVDGGAPSGQTLMEEQVPPLFAASMATWTG
ncbi:MAG: cytochrome c [Vicinamibacterales bacterium]